MYICSGSYHILYIYICVVGMNMVGVPHVGGIENYPGSCPSDDSHVTQHNPDMNKRCVSPSKFAINLSLLQLSQYNIYHDIKTHDRISDLNFVPHF